uniref:Uncharacterized protein n=1 Tax=Romanomermis culicivorax TaxID=13658 RepID=A0A915KB04_ROMCU
MRHAPSTVPGTTALVLICVFAILTVTGALGAVVFLPILVPIVIVTGTHTTEHSGPFQGELVDEKN